MKLKRQFITENLKPTASKKKFCIPEETQYLELRISDFKFQSSLSSKNIHYSCNAVTATKHLTVIFRSKFCPL